MRLEGRVALITGGAGAMGVAIAERFLLEGAKVILIDLFQEKLDAVLREKFNNNAERVAIKAANVADLNEMEAAVAFAEQTFGKIDILVTTAGIIRHKPIADLTMDDWNDVLTVNTTGVFVSCKATIPALKRNGYGRIVCISSIAGRTGRSNCGVNYSASKAAIGGITRQLAYDLGPFGITVNNIAPGTLIGGVRSKETMDKNTEKAKEARIPRLGTMEEIAGAVMYLVSEEAGWTTGETMDVNGGMFID